MKRILSALLCLTLVLAIFPASAFAYSTTSNRGVDLVYPDEWDYYDVPFEAEVKMLEGHEGIYIMPMPESGHGHLGSVLCGKKVTILAECNGYFFFVTAKGYYGWNGIKWFDYRESDVGRKGGNPAASSEYPTISSKGVTLRFPSDRYWLDDPFTAYVQASRRDGAIYLMPRPEQGNGNLGTVASGSAVTILAQQGGYYFFVTEDGRYGWNGTRFFSF